MEKQISFRVLRSEPGREQAPRYETYRVPAGEGFMVLDALQYVREHIDPSLRFRHSCHMGKCGSCALTVNGKPGLACWELAVDGMTLEPLRGFPVVGDLVVERTEEDFQKAGLVFERKAPGPARGCLEKLVQPFQKQYDEARTCIQCFSCVAACPYIYAEEKEFAGPKQMAEITRLAYDPRVDIQKPLKVALSHGAWDCAACRACLEVCPQQIDARQRILDLRTMIMENPALEGVPRQVRKLNESVLTLSNPYHFPRTEKNAWAKGRGVKDLSRGDRAEWLYFAGCAQSYDERDQNVARELAELFAAASLDFGTLGAEEPCCGDPARFTGEETLYQHLRGQNAELLGRYGVKKMVATCPHGFNLFNNDWAGEGREVKHYTQLLAMALADGRLQPRKAVKRVVAYHDSCYLGRYNGVYEEPREVLRALPGLRLVEMKDNRAQSLCCGGGGGGSFVEVKAKPRLSWVRVRQALDAGADTLAVACPLCRTMLEDAVKALEAPLEVRQISELVRLSL
jgi:succinate dehydrogenase/fumarate reductase iron-sulfur protein